MRYAFQDDENCFFVLDLMLGGDLRCTSFIPLFTLFAFSLIDSVAVHLERLGYLSEDTVRFYLAEIASALSYLHDKKIIHRCASWLPIG